MAGVYGVMAFVAGQRSKEIAGRRRSVQARAASCGLMLSRRLKITAIGLTAGVPGAIASTRLVSGMLLQVQPHDVVTNAGVVGALGLLAHLATYLPARRATRIDLCLPSTWYALS
jgi:putative ABC transport system permease protein